MEPETKKAFSEIIKTVEHWKPEIFAYFDHRKTNAYTEGTNSAIRNVDRPGRGYSFDAIRAKVLYGGKKKQPDNEFHVVQALKVKRPKAERFYTPDEEAKRHGEKPPKRKATKKRHGK